MEGRFPNSIMLTLATCNDPAHLDEWTHWYNHIHVPDVTSAGVFIDMMRFQNDLVDPEGRDYLNLSESSYADPMEGLEVLKELRAPFRDQDRHSPYTQTHADGGPFVKVGGQFQAVKNAPVRSIFVAAVSLDDDTRGDEFNTWYNDVHVPDMLEPGHFQSVYRYRKAGSAYGAAADDREVYLAIYETDRTDGAAAFTETIGEARFATDASRIFTGMDIKFQLTASRIWPLEGR